MQSNLGHFRALLEDMLSVASADAATQIAWLQKITGKRDPTAELVDELALDFHDAFVYSRQLLDEGEISQTVYNVLATVDNKLDQMSGPENASLWCFDALRNRSEWKNVRHLAQTALELYRAEK